MLVDPEILRAFAAQTTTTAGVIDENTLKGAVSQGFAGMSGSSCLWVARLVDEFAAGLTEALSEGFNGMASAARGSADNYEATDEFLAASFGGTFHS